MASSKMHPLYSSFKRIISSQLGIGSTIPTVYHRLKSTCWPNQPCSTHNAPTWLGVHSNTESQRLAPRNLYAKTAYDVLSNTHFVYTNADSPVRKEGIRTKCCGEIINYKMAGRLYKHLKILWREDQEEHQESY
jgi:hypothetical protein